MLGLAAGKIASRDQVGRDSFHRLAGAPLLALGLLRRNLFGGRLKHRRTHVPNFADRHTVAHADASQRCLHFTRLRLCGGCATAVNAHWQLLNQRCYCQPNSASPTFTSPSSRTSERDSAVASSATIGQIADLPAASTAAGSHRTMP